MLVLGLDLETTGLDANNCSITEVGAVLYDTVENKPLEMMNKIVKTTDHLSKKIVDLTGLTDEIIQNHGKDLMEVISDFNHLVDQAEYLVIHNAEFDLKFLKPLEGLGLKGLNLPVIDTMKDLPINSTVHQSVKLPYLAASHGFINPFSHRALFDVLTMLKLLSYYDFNKIIEYKNAPKIRVIANVSFDQKDLAKDQGFNWDRSNKEWFKEMKESELDPSSWEFEYSVEGV